jgi:16S rRNA (cytosine1402-N4)-methyltransferase
MDTIKPTHIPVLPKEILEYFHGIENKTNPTFLDGTAGEGGHSELILKEFPNAKLVLNDRDSIMLARATARLSEFQGRFFPLEGNFSQVEASDLEERIQNSKVDGILLDLGISTFHLTSSERGFSFKNEEYLDMRLDETGKLTAFEVLNKYKAEKLSQIFREYGEENWTKKIVEKILLVRKKNPIRTTLDLAKLVESVIPRKFWPDRTHPSFRVFQAVRIEVNNELGHIREGIENLSNLLNKGGILCVISFHSLEDRIVKQVFRDKSKDGMFSILTKKPITPTEEEMQFNISSRSAKLRVLKAL